MIVNPDVVDVYTTWKNENTSKKPKNTTAYWKSKEY